MMSPARSDNLLLGDALMRPSSIVEAHEFGDQASEVRLLEFEHVLEQLTTEGADARAAKAFMFGAQGADRTTNAPVPSKVRTKQRPNFASRSQTSTSGALSKVAFLACCAHQWSVGVYVTAARMTFRRLRSRKKRTNTCRNRAS